MANADNSNRKAWLEPYRFKPGKVYNPGGRPLKLANEIKQLTGGGMEMIHTMINIMRGQKDKHYKYPPKYETRLEATKWLADHVWGKAPMVLTADGTPGTMEIQKLLYIELTRHTNDAGVFDVSETAVLGQDMANQQPVQNPVQDGNPTV